MQLLKEQVTEKENVEKIKDVWKESEYIKTLQYEIGRLNAELKRTNEMFINRDVVMIQMFDGARTEEMQ